MTSLVVAGVLSCSLAGSDVPTEFGAAQWVVEARPVLTTPLLWGDLYQLVEIRRAYKGSPPRFTIVIGDSCHGSLLGGWSIAFLDGVSAADLQPAAGVMAAYPSREVTSSWAWWGVLLVPLAARIVRQRRG